MVTRGGLASLSARAGRTAVDVGATAPSGPVVVKIGGRALDPRGDAARELAQALRGLAAKAVLVHGGGDEVSAWSERLGRTPRFQGGRRVTDDATLEIAVAVLAGLANKRWVAALRESGLDAVGLAALDGGVVECAPHPEAAALGRVAAVSEVAPALLESLLGQGRLPVVASIGAHAGQLLNLNADDVAAALAAALGAQALILLSDVPGVMSSGAVAARLDSTALAAVLVYGEASDGMRPKLEAARSALAAGVPVVHIGAWSGPHTLAAVLAGAAPGTQVRDEVRLDV